MTDFVITEQELLAERENPTTLVLREVEAEVEACDHEIDDDYSFGEWFDFMKGRLIDAIAPQDDGERRRLLVQVATLAVRCIEAHDRKVSK